MHLYWTGSLYAGTCDKYRIQARVCGLSDLPIAQPSEHAQRLSSGRRRISFRAMPGRVWSTLMFVSSASARSVLPEEVVVTRNWLQANKHYVARAQLLLLCNIRIALWLPDNISKRMLRNVASASKTICKTAAENVEQNVYNFFLQYNADFTIMDNCAICCLCTR